jgi:cysteine desulfurase/selenocysteine lyase
LQRQFLFYKVINSIVKNNNPMGVTIPDIVNAAGFQPGDISHTEGYEEMIHNMAGMIRGMMGEAIEQIPFPKLKSELKVPEICPGEEIIIKAIKGANFYFLQSQKNNLETKASSASVQGFDVHQIRKDFPVLQQKVHGNKPLVWLDNAATSQKPNQVIDALNDYYRTYNSNVHRAAHELAGRATDAYEQARQKVQHFMGAASDREIVFVRGTTEGINLIAQTFGKLNIAHGDEIILSASSHHANIVPWQMLANEKRAHLKVIPFNEAGELNIEAFKSMLNPRVKIVAVDHVSNVLGTVNPIKEITSLAHANSSAVIIDGAQSVPHFRPNVQGIDCDFYVFSGHKIFGPTGIGVVYGKTKHWDTIPPYQGGGNMINHVTFEHTTYNVPPYKFEAGTGHIAGAIGLGAALDYIQKIGFEAAGHYEKELVDAGMQKLRLLPGLKLIGTSPTKVSVMSFVVDGIANEDMGKYLDSEGIAVRSGHHCAQPTLAYYGLTSSVRPSIAFYNTHEEIDYLVETVEKGINMLKK